jgi:hypothetical protein
MALYKRGRVYHYRFRINGRRYRGSTNKTTLTAARRIEALTMAQAEERGGVLLLRRSPVLREFSKRFFKWADNQSMLKQTSKDYYANGWRLLADTDVASMRLDAISQDDTGVLRFPGGRRTTTMHFARFGACSAKQKSGGCLERLQRSN